MAHTSRPTAGMGREIVRDFVQDFKDLKCNFRRTSNLPLFRKGRVVRLKSFRRASRLWKRICKAHKRKLRERKDNSRDRPIDHNAIITSRTSLHPANYDVDARELRSKIMTPQTMVSSVEDGEGNAWCVLGDRSVLLENDSSGIHTFPW